MQADSRNSFVDWLLWPFALVWRLVKLSLLGMFCFSLIISLAVAWFVVSKSQDFELMIESGMVSPGQDTVKDRSILIVNMTGQLVEQIDSRDRFNRRVAELSENSAFIPDMPAHELIAAMDRAGDDGRIEGMVIRLSSFRGSYPALLEDVADAMDRFRKKGKRILAVGDYISQPAYYLAAHADLILLDSAGAVDINGFGTYTFFLAELLENLKLSAHAFVAGEYKSAPDTVTASAMSESSKAEGRRWAGRLWKDWKKRVHTRRPSLQRGELQSYADYPDRYLSGSGGDTAVLARKTNLVDATTALAGIRMEQMAELFARTEQEFWQAGDDEVGEAPASYSHIAWEDYFLLAVDRDEHEDDPFIAVVFGVGTVSGSDEGDSFDAWRVVQQIQELNEGTHGKAPAAIVLRLDTPGGSVFASEVVRRAVEESKIPVVVSIGGRGASGGYYIASAADQIWGSPGSITGSIGVFAVLFTVEEAAAWMGVQYDGVGTSVMSGSRTPFTPLSPRLERVFQLSVDFQYQEFKNLVGASRNLSENETEKLAKGQIWTGEEAMEKNLLDGLGNLQDAARAAASLADLNEGEYWIDMGDQEGSFWGELLRVLPLAAASGPGGWLLPALTTGLAPGSLKPLQQPMHYPDPRHLYMTCLECELLPDSGGLRGALALPVPAPG